jgi:hypothetical protein
VLRFEKNIRWPAAAALAGMLMPAMGANAQIRAIEQLVTPGPVAAAHADYEQECTSCHVRFQRGSQRDLCLACHEEIAEDLRSETGFHSLSPMVGTRDCADCHTDHGGRDADIGGLDVARFDHDLTDFPLLGAHADGACENCHMPAQPFREAATQCYGCHAADDRHRGNLGEGCADCHSETGWLDVHFDHDEVVGYALAGAHAVSTCVSCHVEEVYEKTPKTCAGCHRDDDKHMGSNGPQCQDCHVTQNWTQLLFDHFERSGFALADGHADLPCESCHTGNKLEQHAPTECVGCHREDDTHAGINGAVCNDCHRATDWLDVRFDHASDAGFSLNGAHAELMCTDCHIETVATALPGTACYDCHADTDPHEEQLGSSCSTCHGEAGWTTAVRFDHDLTSFPLLGRHEALVCKDCHASQAFHDAEDQCIDCHAEDDAHDRRLGPDCASCHNPNDWLLWIFDHDTRTNFALDGAHANLDCLSCHREPVTAAMELSNTCGSCHRGDDVHRGEFGRDCEQCHTTQSFHDLKVLE